MTVNNVLKSIQCLKVKSGVKMVNFLRQSQFQASTTREFDNRDTQHVYAYNDIWNVRVHQQQQQHDRRRRFKLVGPWIAKRLSIIQMSVHAAEKLMSTVPKAEVSSPVRPIHAPQSVVVKINQKHSRFSKESRQLKVRMLFWDAINSVGSASR